jgi:hypothetical protein
MEVVQNYFQRLLPDYLRELPIPSSVDGFAELGQEEILRLLPLGIFLFSLLTLLLLQLCTCGGSGSKGRINTQYKLKEDKAVDKVKVKDVKPAAAYCRCWKSKKVRERERETVDCRRGGERER